MTRVAILGCGRWGKNHLKTLARLRAEGIVKEIIVIDTCKKARSEAVLADSTQPDLESLESDLVIIATPPRYHSQQAMDLISKGFHVLVEKPFGRNESEVAQIISHAQENGRIVTVGLLLRFHPAVNLANQYIKSGKLGRVETIRFVRRTTRPPPENGNVVESLGVHGIDLACHFMSESEPSGINVQGDNIEARIALEFPHGIEALIDVCWGSSRERGVVEISGSRGSLRFELSVHDQLTLLENGKQVRKLCKNNTEPLESELRHIISCVENAQRGEHWTVIPEHGAALRGVRLTQDAMQRLHVSWPH